MTNFRALLRWGKQLSSVLIIISLMLVTGCKKEDDVVNVTEDVVSEDDLANSIAGSVGGSDATNGLSAEIENAATFASGGQPDGPGGYYSIHFDTTIVKSRSGGNYSFNYTIQYSYAFVNLGNQFNYTYKAKGTFETLRVMCSDSAAATLNVTHIIDANANYGVSGNYFRYGNTSSKINTGKSFTSTTTLTLDTINVNKVTKKIVSGSSTLTITGVTGGGKTFTYTATLVFNGNGQATLTLGNGKVYVINLNTATAEKQS